MRWSERSPQERKVVRVDGNDVVTYSFGDGDEVVLCRNGGPGLPCDYLREADVRTDISAAAPPSFGPAL